MPSAYQSRCPEISNRSDFARCGRVDEQVPGFVVAAARVVLHLAADDPAFRDGTRPDPNRSPEGTRTGRARRRARRWSRRSASSSRCRCSVKRLLRFPGGAVDTLQLFAVLVTAPVRASDPLQLEVAEITGRRYVRTSAEVDELRGVPVRADQWRRRRPPPVARGRLSVASSAPAVDGLDDLDLERLVREELEPRSRVVLLAVERLVLFDDRAHLLRRSVRDPRR